MAQQEEDGGVRVPLALSAKCGLFPDWQGVPLRREESQRKRLVRLSNGGEGGDRSQNKKVTGRFLAVSPVSSQGVLAVPFDVVQRQKWMMALGA